MKHGSIWLATIAGLAVLAGGWPAGAQAGKELKKVSVTPRRADSGVEMFKAYCAACHGVDGKGHGPAAVALKMPPADLTFLKQENGGKFPATKVHLIIEGNDTIGAHGSREMPLWGPIFRSLDAENAPLTKLRIANVTKYIESLQP
jgi:mono/diheme cytochrome c family protein